MDLSGLEFEITFAECPLGTWRMFFCGHEFIPNGRRHFVEALQNTSYFDSRSANLGLPVSMHYSMVYAFIFVPTHGDVYILQAFSSLVIGICAKQYAADRDICHI